MLNFELRLKTLEDLKRTNINTYVDHYLVYAADYLRDTPSRSGVQDTLTEYIKDTICSMIKIMCYDQSLVKVHSHRHYPDGKSIVLPELLLAGYELHWVEVGLSSNATSSGFQWKIVQKDSTKVVCRGSSQHW